MECPEGISAPATSCGSSNSSASESSSSDGANIGKLKEINTVTRMHSSRMRTARLLTVSQHALAGGVPARGGGVPAWGV